jgi:hypothetical protein
LWKECAKSPDFAGKIIIIIIICHLIFPFFLNGQWTKKICKNLLMHTHQEEKAKTNKQKKGDDRGRLCRESFLDTFTTIATWHILCYKHIGYSASSKYHKTFHLLFGTIEWTHSRKLDKATNPANFAQNLIIFKWKVQWVNMYIYIFFFNIYLGSMLLCMFNFFFFFLSCSHLFFNILLLFISIFNLI